ncbi:hypothetical protein M409DRAFT_21140 [Zasmidium cellare ATCC 36951]|uniref:Yeast cell wall synthesis Kre9/Knh1-like N-terminal domain-containing protein n=1 Tax=Zasmidium cellare ATCC 36951 TaxID=1080233 RepID=A0A6A6CRH3_ZASCE|nr:uncharacterized protein M409DRAFT_21140 [Zasmidium cellare ATCC 36951]KAF2168389.1 hypothetical protein M409DRAFT_21140 [Zasmidium cellare ATCC 36951]
MSDFSMFSLFTAGLACLAPLAAAYTQPKGDAPEGNPISQPGLNSIVPVGEGFTITWDPTTKGTVTLVLLKGPSSNAVPQYPIVEKTDNDGSYVWTPSKDLAPSEGAEGYGIQLIDDATGQYQYTTQFGISNPDYKAGSSSSSSQSSKPTKSAPSYGQSSSSKSAPAYGSSEAAVTKTDVVTAYTTYCPEATTFAINNKTYSVSEATTLTLSITKPHSASKPASVWAPVGTGSYSKPHNVTMVAPTGYVPTTIATSAATSAGYSAPTKPTESVPAPSYTGAASTLATSFAGLVLAAGAAVFAL